ncbi:hypothetical protein ACJQWK_05063 [Exserohilum turcicum]|uniref:Uncharacterized protein n=1 Tax=Exserohilum turcicum (strain 28A) TaxID=671987 RepID=R0I965_EXST2|nr:uncharacterized protein SETTUDRAFT_23286 [Exserohilum turcica Et28A]EOA82035.1 hypothetical protein SETTUDRAFT_23286 [Exserohilum turcica Et28A]
MSAIVTEEAFVEVLRTQVQQITNLLSDIDHQLNALEESSSTTRKQVERRQLRSGPKSGKQQRLYQLANQIERSKSQTHDIFEQLLDRLRAFSNTDLTSLKAQNIPKEAVAQNSTCFGNQIDQIEQANIKLITSGATVKDKSTASSKISASTIASINVVPKSPQEPLHGHVLPILPHDPPNEQALNEQAPDEQAPDEQAPNEQTPAPRYPCQHSQLFENMASTIQKAQTDLEHSKVAERGYLILV